MSKLRVHGQRETDPARQTSRLDHGPLKGALTVKHSVRVGFARDGHAPTTLDGVAPDDVVEMELDEGIRLWSRVDDLQADFGLRRARDAGGEDTIDISTQLPLGGQSRGVGDWVIRGLKILGVDVAGEIAEFVADKVEGQLVPGPGLYRCSAKSVDDLSAPRKMKGDRPTLVFLHGTGSSTQGGFGGLWKDGGARIGDIAVLYGEDMLALQHRTLSVSPVENARDLVAALGKILPRGSELHLVSHSRGGLIGELVARGNRVGGGSFDTTDLQLFKGADRKRDREALEELRDLLDQYHFAVTRFVRIACPTRGTTLADRRLDKYLSIILNVLDHIPGLGQSVMFDTFSSLLAAVVKKRTDPSELPGLEAMMPESPLVRLLNRPDVRTDGSLRILGGDIEGTGFFGRLKAFVTDLYYREDHDLVVNTPAMFGGADRVKTPKYWVDTGGRVNHFNYFTNADTASKLVVALADDAAPEFHDIEVPLGAVTESDYRKRAPVPQPVVFVLPGTMGSNLTVNDNRVWVDRVDLARGAMADLRASAKNVKADSLIDGSYRDLVRHLAASHDVVPFPYDWRRPLAESAEVLRKALDAKLDALEGTNQPVRILAHSMGGLVVRTMLATPKGKATWERMCAHAGARFVMLGTPNGGSHAIGAMLMGRDALVKQLAMLDLRHSYGELLAILAEFDGALELLPHTGTLDLYEQATWKKLHEHDARIDRGIFGSKPVDPSKSANVDWAVPDSSRLAKARASRDMLRLGLINANRMIYVAGVAEQTPSDIVLDESAPAGRRVTVMATRRGDGRVPWATGIPPELASQTYYMDAVHGDLANVEESFPAIVDLLNNGTTAKLSQTPPAMRGDAAETFPFRFVDVDAFPDDRSLTAAALGGRRGRKSLRAVDRVRVRVVHDNLVWAKSPILVGHYLDDVFVGAEDFLDRQLQGRLRELQRQDLYPGAYNTATVVLNLPSAANKTGLLPGAVVAGLGTVGELTPGALSSTIAHALTMYGAEAVGIERRRRQDGQSESQDTELRLGVTALLVGAGAGGVRLADSIQCILRGVQGANARLAAAREDTKGGSAFGRRELVARITSVDLCELFEDLAIRAVVELNGLSRVSEFRSDFVFEAVLVPGNGGEQRPTFDDLPGWWQRIRIVRQANDELKFEALTDRARVEASLQHTQQTMVRGLLERAIRTTATDLELGGTLFELLVPRRLKEQAPDRRKLVLVVDETSAALPWELMHDRWDAGSKPLSVDTGMVRQFVTAQFRARVNRAPSDSVLVIGDPPLDGSRVFAQLPGAAAEAQTVATTLREKGFDTTSLIGADAEWPAVLTALYGRPYRVLHIAAHGVHEYEPAPGAPKMTGVVLGSGAFLTSAEFDQLRVVPDLAFINCCHLGRDGEYGRSVDVSFPQLAASVGVQLIQMGVRAVVVAGWAVDDQAAKEFARVFYTEMLAGTEFGVSVFRARQEIYARFGSVNTWGAYQCYGDPGFVLRHGPSTGDDGSFVAERQFRYEVVRIGKRLRGNPDRKREVLQRLERMISTAQSAWVASGETAAAIAETYADLGEFSEALKYYDRALTAEPATASLRSVETLANLLARLAAKQKPVDLKVMRRSTELLQHLAAVGKTGERLSLLGATSKRRASNSRGPQRRRALVEMIKAYQEGYTLALKNKARNPWYPLGNLVAGKVAIGWQAKGPKRTSSVEAEMQALRDYAKQVPGSATDFWELCLPVDVQLLEVAIGGELDAQLRKSLEGAYRTAAQRAGTPKEVSSATGQIEFLRDMALSSKSKAIRALADSLDQLVQALS